MNLIQESYRRLFPNQDFPYQTQLEYNRRLSDFNANIRLRNNTLFLHLNLQWKDIDEEIKIGLIQSLLLKVLKKRQHLAGLRLHTPNIELYNNFIRNIPILTPKTKTNPELAVSFQRINGQFFNSEMEQPNLEWGTASFRKLASYNFHDDTITVSTLFQQTRAEVLDYLMYHELLHKHHKFTHRNGRSAFHTREFRDAEKKYPRQEKIEQEIQQLIQVKRGFSWKKIISWM